MYDLKTVHGKSSVDTQLLDSIGQANRILLNMTSDYNPRTLAKDIRRYFRTECQCRRGADNERDAPHLSYPRGHPWPVVHQELHDEVQTKIKSYR